MDLNNSSNISNIDRLSILMLKSQCPAYILNIFIAALNIIGGTLFLMVKFKNGDYGPLQHCVINEVLSSAWSMASFIYHLKSYVNLKPETTMPFVCYQYVGGVIYFSTNTSILFMFIVSMERALSVVFPYFYNYSFGNFHKSVCISAWIIMILIFGISFLDTFPNDPIPICLARASIGYYSFYFYSYFYLILSVSSSSIYIFTLIYLNKMSSKIDPNASNNNLVDLRRKINDRVSLALMTAVFWHTLTNSVASLATVFIVSLPYRGALIGPYLGAFYYTGAMSFFVCHLIFVEDFRKYLSQILCNFHISGTTTPITNFT